MKSYCHTIQNYNIYDIFCVYKLYEKVKETMVETIQINTKRGVKDKVKKLIGKMQAIQAV